MLKLFSTQKGKEGIFGLDILRAISVIIILITHSRFIFPNNVEFNNIIKYFFVDVVTVFFVLSGFLIGTILIKLCEHSKVDFKLLLNFWKRRWLRTIPVYVTILSIALILTKWLNPSFSILAHSHYYIFSQNLATIHPPFFLEAWSLSIEEWFYIITPLCIFCLILIGKINTKNATLIIAILLITVITSFRAYRFLNLNVTPSLDVFFFAFRMQVITRLDSLMYGIIGAWLYVYYPTKWPQHKLFWFILGLVILWVNRVYGEFNLHISNDFYTYVFSCAIDSAATLALLPYLTSIKKSKSYFGQGLTFISVISYSLYLIHNAIVIQIILPKVGDFMEFSSYRLTFALKHLFFWVSTLVLSFLSYKLIEEPINKLREKH